MNTHTYLTATSLLFTIALATGCDRKEEAKLATQVVARVNSQEITVHQVNNVLARNQNIAPEAAAQAKREILDKLIDQHLAQQKAIENKLDRSPGVVQAIEAAKTEILARAYLEQIAAAIPKTAAWEVQKYYKEHPELFAQRRVFNLEEIAFVAKDDIAAGVREQLPKARSMQEIVDWLQLREVKFAVNRGVRAAEQIPLEILPRLQAMKEGQIQLFEAASDRFQVIRVVAYKLEPVDEATATPRIQQFLWNRRTSEVIAKEMKRIKEQAKIEYVGEFAQGAEAAETNAKAQDQGKATTRGEANDSPGGEARTGPAATPTERSGK
jgi:EpsD family peptidyl-prolyl cis-trans isomerase